MRRVILNHWLVDKNELQISLMNFYVTIKPYVDNDVLYYRLHVVDNNNDNKTYYFSKIEDAISFTEDDINNCYSFDDVKESYQVRYNNKKLVKKQ